MKYYVVNLPIIFNGEPLDMNIGIISQSREHLETTIRLVFGYAEFEIIGEYLPESAPVHKRLVKQKLELS